MLILEILRQFINLPRVNWLICFVFFPQRPHWWMNAMTSITSTAIRVVSVSTFLKDVTADGTAIRERTNDTVTTATVSWSPFPCCFFFYIWYFFLSGRKCRYMYIVYHFFTVILHIFLKFFLMKDKQLFILYSQYHGCWWPGDARNHGISSHSIDLVLLENPSLSTRWVEFYFVCSINGVNGVEVAPLLTHFWFKLKITAYFFY